MKEIFPETGRNWTSWRETIINEGNSQTRQEEQYKRKIETPEMVPIKMWKGLKTKAPLRRRIFL